MNTLARKLTMNAPNRIFNTSYRFVRARWERGCLKDLYHRRVLAGADPMLSRSAYPNWDYRSELFAFSHRIGAAETLGNDQLIRAMTNETFFSRADVQSDSSGAQPSKEDFIESKQHNSQLISIGEHKLLDVISGYLRYSLPSAPEELIQAVTNELSSTDSIASLGKNLGIDCLIRTAEFPPSNESLANAFKALLAVLDAKRAESLVVSVVVPQLLDIDFIEVYPLRDPYQVLTNILQSKGFKCIEPRLQRSAGVVSAEPVYIVGIYADEKLVGKSAGESLSIAVDMASREALLRQWGLSSDRCLPFGERAHSIDFSKFLQPNVYLRDVCNENTDLSLCEYAENSEEVLNVVDVAMQYKQQIEPLVGRSLTKRLRHKFSRGSLAKRSFRHMIKPIVRTVC